jgi:hypothetical protein
VRSDQKLGADVRLRDAIVTKRDGDEQGNAAGAAPRDDAKANEAKGFVNCFGASDVLCREWECG